MMALFDHRVFRIDREWWAAQVHSASGAGYGGTAVPITGERVYFSSLTDRNRNTVTARIPPGWLNRLSHSSLLKVFHTAKDFGTHFKMAAYNAPSLEELGPAIFTDEEGLRWSAHPTQALRLEGGRDPVISEGIEFVCLDDSALRKEISLPPGSSPATFRSESKPRDFARIVEAIKATYREYEPQADETP
jgi:hypothetical protein